MFYRLLAGAPSKMRKALGLEGGSTFAVSYCWRSVDRDLVYLSTPVFTSLALGARLSSLYFS